MGLAGRRRWSLFREARERDERWSKKKNGRGGVAQLLVLARCSGERRLKVEEELLLLLARDREEESLGQEMVVG